MKLNIGGGDIPLDGYINIDRKNGQEAYPLPYDDESVDEIRASHVLEHFSHMEAAKVLKHWVSKLKPGGRIKLAVPNFQWIATNYLAGKPINTQGYVMGGHVDADDRHGSVFDDESLEELMVGVGLERIGAWTSEVQDCASLPVSVNRMGYKPTLPLKKCEKVTAILSTGRYGPIVHMQSAQRALPAINVPYQIQSGAYWHKIMTRLLEEQMAGGSEFILTLDYDTIFTASDVLELYRLMKAKPDIDAVCALQMKRAREFALFSMSNRDGTPKLQTTATEMDRNFLKIDTGHFGLTMIRTSSLAKLSKPWMVGRPDENGGWGDGSMDADIEFWIKWKEAGLSLYLAPRVTVGHMIDAIIWPGKNLKPVWQTGSEYFETGIPPEVLR